MSSFSESVYEVVSKIPAGTTMTYKEVAVVAGSPKACRAVGNILNKNKNPGCRPGQIPCHRVIRSDGKTGGYAFGSETKEKMLKEEAK